MWLKANCESSEVTLTNLYLCSHQEFIPVIFICCHPWSFELNFITQDRVTCVPNKKKNKDTFVFYDYTSPKNTILSSTTFKMFLLLWEHKRRHFEKCFSVFYNGLVSPKVFSPFCHRWSFRSLPLSPLACSVGDTSFPAQSSTWLHRYYLNWTKLDNATTKFNNEMHSADNWVLNPVILHYWQICLFWYCAVLCYNLYC